MSKEKDKCDTCEHRGDSSNEYCGSCGGGVESNWKEAGWSKDKTINELRTRVAELTKKGENLCTSHGLLLCAHDTLKKKNEELQNRLSQAEEKEKELRENWLEDMQEWSVEKATLLKASEGMEKALELLINHTMDCEEDIDKLSGMGNDSGSGSSEYVCAAKQALADFRAVKEGL